MDGFKLVALPKDPYAGVGKPINSSVLDLLRRHFYGKNSGRVEAASFLSQKRVKYTRKYSCLLHIPSVNRLKYVCGKLVR